MNFKDYNYKTSNFNMNYRVFFPDEYEGLSLIVYLHGAGERGEDISHLYRHGLPKLINEGKEIPAVVLTPQCPRQYVWDNIVIDIKNIIDRVIEEFKIPEDRICITGSSMGGYGTWSMGITYPTFFAGVAPVAGGGMSWRTSKLRTTPVLAIHGEADSLVPSVYSKLMVDGVNNSGGDAEYIGLEGYEHNDGIDCAYRNTKLIEWLTEKRRSDFSYIPEPFEEFF